MVASFFALSASDDQLRLAGHHCVRHVVVRIHLPGPERAQTSPQLFDRGDRPLDELHLELAGCIARDLHGLLSGGVIRAVERHDPAEPRNHLLQKLELLRREVRKPAVDARESPSGFPDALA
jgi:hypothetical protein